MIKKVTYLILILTLGLYSIEGQSQDFQRPLEERIESQRIAFITEKVSLSPEEAQSFWPIYNAYRDQIKVLRDQRVPAKKILDMNDAEAASYLDEQVEVERKELNLKIQLTEDLKAILPPRKILRFYAAERLFKERLLQMMRQQQKKRR